MKINPSRTDDLIQTEKFTIKVHRTIFRRSDTKAACHADPADGMETPRQLSRQENSIALLLLSLPAGTKRRDAMLSAVRKYCTPKEQEMIDTLQTLFCIMENQDLFHNP